MALLLEGVLEPGLVSEVQCKHLFVALKQVGDGARSNSDAAFTQCLMDFRDAAMLAVAQRANQGNHVEAELAMRQRPGTLFLGPNGQTVARAAWIVAAAD